VEDEKEFPEGANMKPPRELYAFGGFCFVIFDKAKSTVRIGRKAMGL
jgi:hypothetical protein